MWWRVPVIPTLSRPRKDDYEFETSLGYIAGLYLKKRVGECWEVAQWVVPATQASGPEFRPQHLCENPDMVVYIYISRAEEGEDGQIPGGHWPTNLANQ